MSVVQTLIGNVKGPKGDTGSTGSTGAQGPAATITVGSTTTTAYGNSASVTNVGTTGAAILNFVIPQGKPGEKTTKMGELVLDSITTSQADFPSPQVDDTGATAFGKIVKFFSDTLTRFSKHAGNVATISSSPTTQSFSTGDYLVYNDQLYKVTSNIASGGTLTPGTNISSTSVGTQLDTINDSVGSIGAVLGNFHFFTKSAGNANTLSFTLAGNPSASTPILYFGRVGYDSNTDADSGVITFADASTAFIKSFTGKTHTISVSNKVVSITFARVYSELNFISVQGMS